MTTRKAARAASYLKARAGGFAAEELHHARGHDRDDWWASVLI